MNCEPDRNVKKKILKVTIHHECVIIEDCSSVDFVDSDQIPDNVREQVMRAPHLDQVLCLLRSQFFPLTKFKNINHLKVYKDITPTSPMVEVTVGKPRVRLRDLTTSLVTPP